MRLGEEVRTLPTYPSFLKRDISADEIILHLESYMINMPSFFIEGLSLPSLAVVRKN